MSSIVVLSLLKAIKNTVYYLDFLSDFQIIFWVQIKDCNVVINLVAGWFWFMPYNSFKNRKEVFPQNRVSIWNPSNPIGSKNSLYRNSYKIQTCFLLLKYKRNWLHLASVIDCRMLQLLLLYCCCVCIVARLRNSNQYLLYIYLFIYLVYSCVT